MSKFRKWNLREPKFAKFPGGACPRTPLEARAFGANNYSLFSITWGWNLWKCNYSFFLWVVIFSIYGLLYSQKKILWPWIFHSHSSRGLRGPTLKYIFPFQPFASSALAFSRLSHSGESAKVWKMRKRKAGEKGGGAGKRKFPPSFFLVCTFSILRTRLSRRNMRQQSLW